jgi:tRNA nucleotidyltransferase (CCA-adding enzyme)
MAATNVLKNSTLYRLLNSLSEECLLYLMAKVTRKEAKKGIATFITQLKHTKIKTTGEDLKKLGLKPGKLYSKILDALRDAKLDGKVHNKREEIAFVKKHYLT